MADNKSNDSNSNSNKSGTVGGKKQSTAETARDSGSVVDGLHDTRDGADLDGTRELEQPQDAAEARADAIQQGKDAARENLAREREADKRDGADNKKQQSK